MEIPSPLNKEQILKIYEQMDKCVCVITLHNGMKGTGFFCFVPFKNERQYLPVLVTCCHIIDENTVKENNVISISFSDHKEIRNLEIKNRHIYTNRDYNVTIIEIKPILDKISNFLELDEKIFDEKKEIIFNKQSVYVLQYPKGQCSSVSFGIINNIKKNQIMHNCWTSEGSSGAPILCMQTFKVIGLHKGYLKEFRYKIGDFLDNPINEFQKKA